MEYFYFCCPLSCWIFLHIFCFENFVKYALVFLVHDFCILFLHGGWMEYGNITHTFLWLPLALLLRWKLLQKQTKKYFLALVGTTYCFIFGWLYSRIFLFKYYVVLYFLVRFKTNQYTTEKNIFLLFFLLLFFLFCFLFFRMLQH